MIQGHACGLKTRQLVRLHLLPHLQSLFLPQFLVCVPAFIVAEANLGALGLGVGEPMPSWGSMLLELDNSALLARSHWVYLPIVLLVAVLLILESLTSKVETNA
jgi:ABC-type dipeptide/oligopeptide/nickel transport system permease subunit